MSENVRQTPQERFCDPIVAEHEQDTTSDGTGSQIGPEGPMESLAGLRAYVRRHARMDEMTKAALLVYAREIEREVEGYAEMESFHDRLCRASERREDVTLWGVDYTPLPVGADGVPFHIGDKVDSDHYEDGTVIGVHYFKAPNGVVFEEIAVQPNGWDTATWRDPDEYRHHHAPTVEDVLREFADAWAEWKDGAAMMNPVETFAAKLRLVGEDA